MSEIGWDEEEVSLPTGERMVVPRGERYLQVDGVFYERVGKNDFLAVAPNREAPSRYAHPADVTNETGRDW